MDAVNRCATVEQLLGQRVIPVLRLRSREETARAVACLWEAGFHTFEITLTTPGAIELIAGLKARFGADGVVGAGTVLDPDAARRCIDAGAQFLVSPGLVPGLAAAAHAAGCAVLIGGFTPSEVLAAQREGADIVKVFPASTGGPAHLAALHAVYPEALLCPTGGVSRDNLTAYFAAGAALVGVGNSIVDATALAAGDVQRVAAHARRFLEPLSRSEP